MPAPGAVLIPPRPEPERWHRPPRLAHTLLRSGCRVCWLPRANAGAPAGSFLIPCPDVESERQVMDRAAQHGVAARPWPDTIPASARPLREPRVALYGGGGPPY